MMNLIRITDPGDPRLARLIPLYEEAFPREERRDIDQLERMIREEPAMYFNAIEIDGTLSGLFVYWDFKDFYYLEHLAVFADARNRKVGQQVLDHVARYLDGTRLLEVEPTGDELTTRRVNYYRRNGYEVLDMTYQQPSYREDRDAGNLWIMGNKACDRLEEFTARIKRVAYREQHGRPGRPAGESHG